ncbi:hypothetical protein [Hoeflea ulvae]|uniref:Uncharacterized protein n=1 Tax=Hoeflea ulvae TaxID=2983764 RepID=A0ABT3YI21_9HYPH|nr:hypothetical protein [Hoeflea ulvae]MCY0095472.1 hypothetical protein [Hoeflea ulvae]
MSRKPKSNDETLVMLKIQGLLAAAYDLSRTTDEHFLSYLIKMARMEMHNKFDPGQEIEDEIGKPDDMDRF